MTVRTLVVSAPRMPAPGRRADHDEMSASVASVAVFTRARGKASPWR